MNKKRNFAKTALLGVLLCGLAGPTFVGCKDYDDDIDGLQEQVNTLNKNFEELKKLVNDGKAITSVTPITGGFKITFNDNTSYDIVNGKDGEKGNDGADGVGTVVSVDENGHLIIDNVDKGKVVNEAAADVVITIGEDGYIYVNGTKQEGAKVNTQTGASYAVDHEKFVEFYVVDEKGNLPETPVKIWKNAALSGLLTIPNYLVDVAENGLLFPTIYGVDKDGAYVRLYAGKVDLKYQINPKGATVENPEFVKQQILARSANNGILVSDVNVDGEYLTLRGKAMSGLYSYNELEDVTDEDSYIWGWDMQEGMIDPSFNIVALKVQNQGEELISDYVMGFDYNISQNDVTIEKKFVEEGETEYKDVLAKTGDEAKAADAHFTLVYKDGKGELKLADEIAAFFKRTGLTNKEGKFEFTTNGFDEHSYKFEKVEFLFEDNDGNKEDHCSYVNLAEDGTLTIKEASDEKGSSIGRTPIIKITLVSDVEVNHGKDVKTVYAKVLIAEKEAEKEIPAYTQALDYLLNNVGTAQYLQLDKLYGHVATHLGILGADKFHTIYTTFEQITEVPFDSEIQLKMTGKTETEKNEWLAVYVPNYKKAGQYQVKGVFKSTDDNVYPPVYVIYTVNVKYPVGPYLMKRTDADQGGNFWEGGHMLVNGVFDKTNDYVFDMGGKIADAFIYNLPYDENPWDAAWNIENKVSARANIQYTFVNPAEKDANIVDINATTKEDWKGEISVTKLPADADYRDIDVQPVTWFNLDLDKMVNNVATGGTISMTDGLKANTETKFTVRFVSPLKSLVAKGGELDKNNTTIDQTLNIMKSIVVKDKKDVVLYEKEAFEEIIVDADGTTKRAADKVYQISAPKFEWADENSKAFAAQMEQRGGKCSIDETTGIITFHATGEVGAVNLKVKVSMDCPWRKLETIVTVAVK